jgi:hypothetical protein
LDFVGAPFVVTLVNLAGHVGRDAGRGPHFRILQTDALRVGLLAALRALGGDAPITLFHLLAAQATITLAALLLTSPALLLTVAKGRLPPASITVIGSAHTS